MEKHRGIILKMQVPSLKKGILFDRDLGKIEITAAGNIERLSAGCTILYYYTSKKHLYYLEMMEIIQAPFELARENIYFLHHILELCYFFLPFEVSNCEVFSLLELLLQNSEQVKYAWFKKIFLLRLFTFLGMYPESQLLQDKSIKRLLAGSFLQEDTVLDIHTHQALMRWFADCISLHPQRSAFKTLAIGSEHVLYD